MTPKQAEPTQFQDRSGGTSVKAVRIHKFHETPVVDDVPEPKITNPLDVIVKIGGAGVCRTDLHIIEGQWAQKSGVTLPYTLGHENAGWVHEIGSAVGNVEVGDAVIVHPLITCGLCRACRAGDDMHCETGAFPGIDTDGGFAELLKTNARAVVKLDPAIEPQDVAAHADAGLTAYHAVKKAAAVLQPGTRAVVIGAGGLGHIGIQCLKALTAAEIIVVDPLEPALELARGIGADQTVEVRDGYVDTVLEMTDGKGAEAVVDFVGEKGATADGVAMLRDGGSYYVIGYGENLDIPTIDIISREISFSGNLVGTYNDLAELMVLAQAGKVRLHTKTYPLDSALEAFGDLEAGDVRGRAILVP
jgi:NAD+-dependent secondary alcohol dehydrogenase Adh1